MDKRIVILTSQVGSWFSERKVVNIKNADVFLITTVK